EHPPPDVGDERRLLGERYERCRRHQPAGWMRPTQEGLDAHDPPVDGAHDRLVVEPQLAVPTGVAQVALQAYAVLEQVLLAEVDGLVAGPALAFRLVHGD